MIKTYERKCPVCGETFVTKHVGKRFCCSECIDEYNDIKKYLSARIEESVINLIKEARATSKTEKQLFKEFIKKW